MRFDWRRKRLSLNHFHFSVGLRGQLTTSVRRLWPTRPQAPSSINVAHCFIPVIFLDGITYSWYTKELDVWIKKRIVTSTNWLHGSAVSTSVRMWTPGLWAVHLLDRTAATHSFVYTCSRGLSSTPQDTSNVGRRSMKPRFRCIHEHKHIQTGDGHRKITTILYEASILWLICTTSIQWWSIVSRSHKGWQI